MRGRSLSGRRVGRDPAWYRDMIDVPILLRQKAFLTSGENRRGCAPKAPLLFVNRNTILVACGSLNAASISREETSLLGGCCWFVVLGYLKS